MTMPRSIQSVYSAQLPPREGPAQLCRCGGELRDSSGNPIDAPPHIAVDPLSRAGWKALIVCNTCFTGRGGW